MKNVDLLSTVALGLAVLAFAIQIIVFSIQEFSANLHATRSQELYAATLTALAQIEERTLGTQTSLDRIDHQLLSHLLEQGKSRAREKGVREGSEEFSDTVANSAASALREVEMFPPPLSADRAKSVQRELSTFPDRQEFEKLVDTIARLGDDELGLLLELAVDLQSSAEPGASVGPGVLAGASPISSQRLVNSGLAIEVWNSSVGSVIGLTPNGRKLARLLVASPIPEWAIEPVAKLRATAELLRRNYFSRDYE